MSYTDFSVTFIHNKYWATNSVVVPKQQPILDQRWHRTEDLFKTEDQKFNFEIYWQEYMVGGEVCIPGEWNYACVNGKFFHLEKTKTAGFIDDQETFYYSMIYDDWTNDWQKNNVNLCGTINLTGDRELVKQHIVQTTPLISNVNNFRYLNGIKYEGEGVVIRIPENESKWIKPAQLSSFDFVTINKELERLRLGEPNRDKLVIPFLYRTTKKYDWKWLIIKAIKELETKSIGIFDVDQSNEQRRVMEVKFNTNELYTISTKGNKAYNYAKTLNEGKYIEEIDLSGFTDLIPLATTTLTPLYSSIENTPKFSLRGLCEKLRSRFNWNRELIPRMEEVMTKVFAEGLGDLINREVDLTKKKVFKNVTVAPIKRDIIWQDFDNDLKIRNPKWVEQLDSLIPEQKWYRNFIFTRDDLKSDDMKMIAGTKHLAVAFAGRLGSGQQWPANTVSNWLFNDICGKPKWSEWVVKYIERQRKFLTQRSSWVNFTECVNVGDIGNRIFTPFRIIDLCKSRGVQLVLPIHTHKLVEEGREDSDELDFTRTDWYDNSVLMLIPDYERKTHVLSIRCPTNEQVNRSGFGLFFDEQDTENPLRGQPIYPYITTELFEINETSVTDARWRKNLHNEWTKTIKNYWYVDPSTVAKHMIQGTYKVKYKTYRSQCRNTNYCSYDEWTTYYEYKPSPKGYRVGTQDFLIANVLPDGSNWYQYQMEFTLPYSERLINILNAYSALHDIVFAWKVVNSDVGKGKNHPNPLMWKNGKIQRMNDSDLKNLGTKDIIAIWINPNNMTGWFYPLATKLGIQDVYRQQEEWFRHGLLIDEEGLRSRKQAKALILANTLIDWLTNNSYWPHPEVTPYYLIPLRIYNDALTNPQLKESGRSQLSTGMVRPYDGFDYLCYYRFYSGTREFEFAFSDTSTPYQWDGRDYFTMVIPNKYAESSYPVPTYSYREKTNNLSRESNIAYLVNGAYSLTGDSLKEEFYTGWWYSNNHGEDGWRKADELHDRMKAMVNQADIFFEEFVKKEFKSNRTCNPTVLKNEYRYNINGYQSFNITTLDDEIPPFMVKYLDPDDSLCQTLHSWRTSNSTTDEARLRELQEKLTTTVTGLKVLLSTQNHWFQLEGTDWYASVKLNIEDAPTWDFELFTTRPNLIKSRVTDIWNFENHREEDIDVLINTSNELNLYGKRIMQKSRYISDADILDLRVKITPLKDPKQTITSTWYKVDMKTEYQDLMRDTLEIPKEQVKTVDMSVYERERILRDIDLRTTERSSEAQLHELSRERFKIKDAYEYNENARRGFYRSSMATADIFFGGVKGALLGWNIFKQDSGIAGVEQMVKGGINLVDALWESGNAEIDRKARFAVGSKELDVKGARMQKEHEVNRLNAMDRLSQMSSKIQYPQMTSGLIYKEYNKSEDLNDVYMTQYYPSGNLLKYIKEYYKEYGYEILVRDFTCNGVESIKRHLRYINIFKNEHTNERIKTLIQARALNGIFVSDSEFFW